MKIDPFGVPREHLHVVRRIMRDQILGSRRRALDQLHFSLAAAHAKLIR